MSNCTLNIIQYKWEHLPTSEVLGTTTSGDAISIKYHGSRACGTSYALYQEAEITLGNKHLNGTVAIIDRPSLWATLPDFATANVVLVVSIGSNTAHLYNKRAERLPLFLTPISSDLVAAYNELLYSKNYICNRTIASMDSFSASQIFSRLLAERLEHKEENIILLHKKAQGSWADTIYAAMFDTIAISNKTNRAAFNKLSTAIKHSYVLETIRNSQDNIETTKRKMEAILFGTAGFLQPESMRGVIDEYTYDARKYFERIKLNYNISPLNLNEWNMASFNKNISLSLLLAQLAAFFAANPNFYHSISAMTSLSQIELCFNEPASSYWDTHTELGVESAKVSTGRKLSIQKREVIMINFILPLLFYIRNKNLDQVKFTEQDIIEAYETIPPEYNTYTRRFEEAYPIKSAFDSQAIIELCKMYCDTKNCWKCTIGMHVLSKVKL